MSTESAKALRRIKALVTGERHLADECDRALSEPAAPPWQPIETAPRKVEFRCLLGHQNSVVTGYWDGDGWRNERSHTGSYFPATHWMPLPDPPEES